MVKDFSMDSTYRKILEFTLIPHKKAYASVMDRLNVIEKAMMKSVGDEKERLVSEFEDALSKARRIKESIRIYTNGIDAFNGVVNIEFTECEEE